MVHVHMDAVLPATGVRPPSASRASLRDGALDCVRVIAEGVGVAVHNDLRRVRAVEVEMSDVILLPAVNACWEKRSDHRALFQ